MSFPWQGSHPLEASVRRETYDIAAPLHAQGPATRSAAERWPRSVGGAPCHASRAGARARSRPPAAPAVGSKHGPERIGLSRLIV